jgi:transposase
MAGAGDMTFDISKARMFIRPGHTDLRKAVNGLSVMIEQEMAGEPFSGDVYLFCNRGRRLLKAVWRDRNGFWLAQKTERNIHFVYQIGSSHKRMPLL